MLNETNQEIVNLEHEFLNETDKNRKEVAKNKKNRSLVFSSLIHILYQFFRLFGNVSQLKKRDSTQL